jgi:hypothetical protein
MSFRFSFAAAALMSARTRFRVALLLSVDYFGESLVLANACMSFASNSHAVSCPSHPLLFWIDGVETDVKEAPIGISDPFVWI